MLFGGKPKVLKSYSCLCAQSFPRGAKESSAKVLTWSPNMHALSISLVSVHMT